MEVRFLGLGQGKAKGPTAIRALVFIMALRFLFAVILASLTYGGIMSVRALW